ncbi:hypothetical protein N7523_010907 [Penicillium sp. IBT 18751x]|nr:hypothetical protein N7523_010907 [Penicillium sp. IBT 18751x]
MAIASMSKAGQAIVILGLFVQLIFFGGFLTISVIFAKRLEKAKGSLLRFQYGALLYVLFGVSGLIIIRCIYRVIEFCQGNDGYLMGHEVFLYVFDTIPMFVVQVIFHFYHPGKVLVLGDYEAAGMIMV